MPNNLHLIKTRINSINSTKKITKAMQLIAQIKLAKDKKNMENNREYSTTLSSIANEMISNSKNLENKFLSPRKSDKELFVLFQSDMGLCGGYNVNMLKLIEDIDKSNPIILIGSKNRSVLINEGYNIINDHVDSDNSSYEEIKNLLDKAIDLYLNNEIGKISVVYTKFHNTVNLEPVVKTILPFEKSDEDFVNYKETEFEPCEEVMLDHLIPMMVKNVIYSMFLETRTSEQASRRVAMESATDNANELQNDLMIKFNQARQAAITQEISEIVGGADAL